MNPSGIDPLDHRVILRLDKPPEKSGSLLLPPSAVDKEKFAMTSATVIAVGSLAWAEARHDAQRFGVPFEAPSPGDRVRAGKYVGDQFEADDGETYTICNDVDVIGRLIEPGR